MAYWVGPQSVAASVPGSGAVWVVPVGGGQPLQVGLNFATARFPFWHKDGKHLLILGYTSTRAFDSSSIDWWVVATDGSDSGTNRRPRRARSGRPTTGRQHEDAGSGSSGTTLLVVARRQSDVLGTRAVIAGICGKSNCRREPGKRLGTRRG